MKMGFYGDTLLHRERTFELLDQPLEQYFELIGTRPALETGFADAREYKARWMVEDGWLFLVAVNARWNSEEPLNLQHLFPFAGAKVFAAWYNGPVRAYRRDKPLPDMSMPDKVRYPDVTLQVEHGRIANTIRSQADHDVASMSAPAGHGDSAQVIEMARYRRPALNAAFEDMML